MKKKLSDHINIETAPQDFPKEKIIRICLTDDSDNHMMPVDHDAMSMSQQFPEESFITVYENGIPTTLSVKQLISDTLIHVLASLNHE